MRKVVDLKRLKVFPATITVENRSRSPVYYGAKNVTKKTGLELRYKRQITFDAFPLILRCISIETYTTYSLGHLK